MAWLSCSSRALSASGAADQKLFESADTVVEIVGDLKGTVAQCLVHLADLDADRIRNLDAARIDGAGHFTDTLIKCADHFLAAFGQGLCELGNACAEQRFELGEPLVERAGNVASPPHHALVERIEIIAKSLCHILGPLTEPPDQFAAIILYGVVEFGDVASDKVAEGRGGSRYFFAELRATLIEHGLEGLQARRQHFLDRIAAATERSHHRFRAFAESIGYSIAAIGHCIVDARPGLFELRNDIAATQRKIKNE